MWGKKVISTQLIQGVGCFHPDFRTQNAFHKNPKWPLFKWTFRSEKSYHSREHY